MINTQGKANALSWQELTQLCKRILGRDGIAIITRKVFCDSCKRHSNGNNWTPEACAESLASELNCSFTWSNIGDLCLQRTSEVIKPTTNLPVPIGSDPWAADPSFCESISAFVKDKSGIWIYPETIDDVLIKLEELGHIQFNTTVK